MCLGGYRQTTTRAALLTWTEREETGNKKGKWEREEKGDTSQIWRVILQTPNVLPGSSARAGQCQRYP